VHSVGSFFSRARDGKEMLTKEELCERRAGDVRVRRHAGWMDVSTTEALAAGCSGLGGVVWRRAGLGGCGANQIAQIDWFFSQRRSD